LAPDPLIAEAFRAAVTVHLSGEDPLTFQGVFTDVDGIEDLQQFAGLGVAMTGALCAMLAEAWTMDWEPTMSPADVWVKLCEVGREHGLPGMM
jgi:hypothetical protein